MSLVTGSYDSSVMALMVGASTPIDYYFSYQPTVQSSSPIEFYSNQYLATFVQSSIVSGKRNSIIMKSPTPTSPRIIPATPGQTFSTVTIKESTV